MTDNDTLRHYENMEIESVDSAPTSSESKAPTADDFVLLKPISKGAFGKVWLGYKKPNPNRIYAIKVMKKDDLIKKNLMAQVTAERDAQARSLSAFVVQLYYSVQSQQNIFLIMDYMIGGDVRSLLIMYGFFPEEMACFYAAEVTLALAYLHKLGIVHRDLKPDNMLISNTGHIKLTDFGLSKVAMDYRASPQPGCFTPFGPNYGGYVDLRTPGQILSLKSSLTFTVDRKLAQKQNEIQDESTDTTPISDQKHSPVPPEPQTPPDRALRQSFGRRMLTPADSKQMLQTRRLHGTVLSTPPVKSLTPTLHDSLSWRNSSASDSQSRLACSLLQASLLSRANKENLSVLTDSDSCQKPVSCRESTTNCETHTSDCDNNVTSFSCRSDSVFSDCGDSIEVPRCSDRGDHRSWNMKGSHDQLSCDSHVLPIFRLECEDDETPLLHRTHNSVWSSYAAVNLRSMREGSYSEDNHYGSFCCSSCVDRSDAAEMHSNKGIHVCNHLLVGNMVDTNSSLNGQLQFEASNIQTLPALTKPTEDASAISSVKILASDSYEQPSDMNVSHHPQSSNICSISSVEVARGVVNSLDESLCMIRSYSKSRLVSVAGSADLEGSSDFSAHLHRRDQILNSTRMSLDFGPSQISLDSGPELKDMNQLSGLSRMVLKPLPAEDNRGTSVPRFNVVPSKKSERLLKKQSDLISSGGLIVRKLSKPGLRRVLSDTFDRCISYSSESTSSRSRNILQHKSKSMDLSSVSCVESNSPVDDCKKLHRKRAFQNSVSDYPGEELKKADVEPETTFGLMQDISRRINENDDDRPRKQICVDRNFLCYSQTESQFDGGKQRPIPSNRFAGLRKKSEPRNLGHNACEPLLLSSNLKHNFASSSSIKINFNIPPQHPKVAFLREGKLSHFTCSSHTGLTDEVNALMLKDIVARSQIATKTVKNTGGKNEQVELVAEEDNSKMFTNRKTRSISEESFDDCIDAGHLGLPLHRVSASVDLSSQDENSIFKMQNKDDLAAFAKDMSVKFFIATPSPGPTMHSSPAPGNVHHSPPITSNGLPVLDNSIGNDSHLLNVTIEYEEGTNTKGKLSPRPVAISQLSDSFVCDTDSVFSTMQAVPDQTTYQHFKQTTTPSSQNVKPETLSLIPKDDSQQKQVVVSGGDIGDVVIRKQQKLMFSERMPCIAEGVRMHENEADHTVFVKPRSCPDDKKSHTRNYKQQAGDSTEEKSHAHTSPLRCQKLMTSTVQTPNPWTRDAAFQTPGAHYNSFSMPGAKFQTPMRTPKSVRRGPEMTQDEGRILGTPDYLAPEILLQKPHGFAVDWWALGVCLYEFLTGLPPFNDQTPEAVFENILNRNISWPDGEEALSDESRAAIEALLTVDADKRPASKEVKAMPFFSSIDWANLLNVEAPFVPQPEDHMDTTYFEPKNAVRNIVLSAVSM